MLRSNEHRAQMQKQLVLKIFRSRATAGTLFLVLLVVVGLFLNESSTQERGPARRLTESESSDNSHKEGWARADGKCWGSLLGLAGIGLGAGAVGHAVGNGERYAEAQLLDNLSDITPSDLGTVLTKTKIPPLTKIRDALQQAEGDNRDAYGRVIEVERYNDMIHEITRVYHNEVTEMDMDMLEELARDVNAWAEMKAPDAFVPISGMWAICALFTILLPLATLIMSKKGCGSSTLVTAAATLTTTWACLGTSTVCITQTYFGNGNNFGEYAASSEFSALLLTIAWLPLIIFGSYKIYTECRKCEAEFAAEMAEKAGGNNL